MNEPDTIHPTRGAHAVVIEAPGRMPSLGLGELWSHRAVGIALARRNVAARYRQTLLGAAWVLLQPLALMIVLSVFFSLISRGGYDGIPYAVWFITGLAIWGPAMKMMTEGATSLTANPLLVMRVYVPRPLIPISVAMTTLVDLAFTLTAMLIILLLFGYTPNAMYLVLPFFILVAYMLMVGVALITSALNVAYRDFQVAMPFIERIWFFMSPLLYPAHLVPEQWWPLYYLNPMALVLSGFHWVLLGTAAPPAYAFVEGTVVSVACLVGGYLLFKHREPTFADVL